MEEQNTSPLGFFERYLSVWVALCISCGLGLGTLAPNLFQFVAGLEYSSVNLVVAVFIWVMIYPMMVNVDFGSLKDVTKKPKGLCVTLVVNWLIKPFSMAALGVLFFNHIFAGLVSPENAKEYIAGMILLGVAPCTAMVFVWSQLRRRQLHSSASLHQRHHHGLCLRPARRVLAGGNRRRRPPSSFRSLRGTSPDVS